MRQFPAIPALLFATRAHAQRLGGAPEEAVSFGRVLAALVLCLAAAFGLALVIKARSGKLPSPLLKLATGQRHAEQIEVTASRRLSINAEIHIVRCRQIEYVLLCGANSQQVLERRDVAALDAGHEQMTDVDRSGIG